MILLLVFCISAVCAQTTIIDVLTKQRATTLLQLIDDAGLTDTLKGAGPFTIFAPTNRGFSSLDASTTAALKADKNMLAGVLKYHVVAGNLQSADIRVNERQVTTLAGSKIRLNHYVSTGATTANGVPLSTTDHTASNGVVHMVNGVLTPPAGTVVDIASADPELSTLVQAVKAAGLAGFLADQNPITVFAPTNEAFAALGGDVVGKILADTALLKTILTYHVIPGSLYTGGYHSAKLHTFDPADQIRLHKFFVFGYEVDSASISQQNIPATNGVIHKLKSVMVPASVAGQVQALMPQTTIAPST